MKASSADLELEIHLSPGEAVQLKSRELEGILQFNEMSSETKKLIPLKLKYVPGKKESLVVNHIPSGGYFGDSTSITIELQDYFYINLIKNGSCGDRFLGSGKVLIYVS